MPEGPEIRRAADRIEKVVRGHRATEVFFAFERLRPYAAELHGRTITRIETRGKAMLSWFDDELAVYSHNQLYGRWFVRKRGLPKTGRQLRFAMHTENGSALLYSASDISVHAREDLAEHPFLSKLGPDPLVKSTTARRIRSRLRSATFRRRRLAGLLLDQSFLSGLGNYLRSEILFDARLHPNWRPLDLDEDEVGRLARSINRITRRAYRTGGITNDAARVRTLKAAGRTRREYRHYVFARAQLPCRVCGERVEKEELGGRRIYFCPNCQPG
ncbi:MAG: endonuclease VIII [Myxococcota bacterium]